MEGSYFLGFLYSNNVEHSLILMSLNARYRWVEKLSWAAFQQISIKRISNQSTGNIYHHCYIY